MNRIRQRARRWLYGSGRPNGLARVMNRADAWLYSGQHRDGTVVGATRRESQSCRQGRTATASTSKSMSGRASAATPMSVCAGGWLPQIRLIARRSASSLASSWSTM